jgi:hypothetical protein
LPNPVQFSVAWVPPWRPELLKLRFAVLVVPVTVKLSVNKTAALAELAMARPKTANMADDFDFIGNGLVELHQL